MTTATTTKIDLLLLGLLLDRPMHGYEIHRQIQAEGIDTWFNVSLAGVYYSLGKLRDQGLVAESRQRGARSARKSIYRLTEEELTGPSRSRRIARPRQVAMYLMRQETNASLPQIGKKLGGRDHTTAIHACTRIITLMDEDENLRREVQAIREQLYRKAPLRQPVC